MKVLSSQILRPFLVLFISLLSLTGIQAIELSPTSIFKISGVVSDFVVVDNQLYAATESGAIDVFDLSTGDLNYQVSLPLIKDFMGDEVRPRVHSVDAYQGKVLIVSQGEAGYSNLYIYSDKNLIQVLDAEKDRMLIMKGRFLSFNKILLALLSNEYILYDLESGSEKYRKQISTYAFSDFSIDKANERFITADESGTIYMVDAAGGKILKEFSGANVDKVFGVGYRNGSIISGGQDRRIVVYDVASGDYFIIQKDYLVYSVALNNDGTLGAYANSESHNIVILNMDSRQEILSLKGHDRPVIKIIFNGKSQVLSTGTENEIYIWQLEE